MKQERQERIQQALARIFPLRSLFYHTSVAK